MRFYINGVLQVSNVQGTADGYITGATKLLIGGGFKQCLRGLIDEAYIYGRALSVTEVNTVMNSSGLYLPGTTCAVAGTVTVTGDSTINVFDAPSATLGGLSLTNAATIHISGIVASANTALAAGEATAKESKSVGGNRDP